MRMKKRYILLLTMLVLSAAAIFSGCGKKITAEDLMDEVAANIEKADSASINMAVDVSMKVTQSGVGMNMDVTMDMDMDTTKDPLATYMKGSVSVLFMDVDMEMYAVEENGKYVTYTGVGGEWSKTEQDKQDSPDMDYEGLSDIVAKGTSYELQDKTEKVDGKEVYVLTEKISGKSFDSVIGELDNEIADFPIDWDKMELTATIKIDAKTKLPVEMTADLGDAMTEVMEGIMSEIEEDVEITITDFVLTITFNDFNNVDEIVVPENVKAAAQDTGDESDLFEDFLNGQDPESDFDPDFTVDPSEEETVSSDEEDELTPNADGTYTLTAFWRDGGSVNIAVPDGYELSPYADSTYLYFNDTLNLGSHTVSIAYMLDNDYTEEEMVEYYMRDINYYQDSEDYSDLDVQEKKVIQVDGRDVSFLRFAYTFDENMYCVEYHAWTFLEDGSVIQCDVEETNFGEECNILDDSIVETAMSVFRE